MLHTLEIVDGRTRKAKPCAWLFYDTETDEFNIRLAEGLSTEDVPLLMEPFVEKGQLDVGPMWSRRWVEERVPPAGRQNLGEILRAHELEEYDPFALLKNNRGESAQDYFVVRLPETEEAEGRRAARRRARGSVGFSVASARKAAGLKQGELAARVGVGQAVISRIETGKANATVDLLADIAFALGLDIGELFEPAVK